MQRGERVGPYEISGHVGTGGMGEVYRARDTRLNREVAVKVLPELFARDPERLARFTREAQALASLNHPNVAHVYGVEERALVMELVEGEDLAQRLTRGPVPLDDAVPIALQIACGLEAAHERGIVHRDLKPGNIRIAVDGTAKILDFGLAKAMDADPGAAADPLNSPTFTSPATQMGVILGTAAYMAPEQARGRPVDKRADIWAFGCVVYEMLTARRPFGGDTVTDALAAIVKEDPDWSALPPDTPPALRELVRRCLVKDPKQRLRDIGDARISLERLASGSVDVTAATPPAARPPHRISAALIAGALVLVFLFGMLVNWLLTRNPPAPSLPMAHFVTPLSNDALPLRLGGAGVAFAPDGTSVVYAGQPALMSAPMLFRRRLDALDVAKVPNTERAQAPFFSPDGRWVGFFTDSGVMKVSPDGSGLAKICDRTRFSRASWAAGDTLVLGTSLISSSGPLAKVSASGGTPTDLTALTGNETAHQLPHILPDGDTVLFTAISPGRSELAVVSLSGGAHQSLGIEGSGPVFVPPGHLLFARGRTLFAARFDPRRRQILGNAVQVLEDVGVLSVAANVWIPMVAVDRAGSVAYLNRAGTLSTLRWIAPASVAIAAPDGDYRLPKLSPDGRRVAVAAGTAPAEVWIIDLDRGTRLLLASNGGASVVWSHDGRRLIYSALTGDIMTVPSDGSGAPEMLVPREGSISVIPTGVAPDGSFIVANAENRATSVGGRNRDVWIVRPGQKPVPIVATPGDDRGAAISPDGKWLAYSSSVSGREEIYIKSVSGSGATIPVSTQGGTQPRWPRQDALYFLGPRALMRVPLSGDPLAVGAAVEAAALPQNIGGVDVHPDGRILIVEPKATPTGTRDALHVLLNWGASLK